MGFNTVLKVHEHLSELFLQHQEALVKLDVETALDRLEVYRKELSAHMYVEEHLLLPVYERAGVIPGGPPEFFIGEHERMSRFLDRFGNAIEELRYDRTDLLRKVIAVLDEEAAYKSLVEHHDQRERNLFFPALDRVTTEAERSELIERCLKANGLDEEVTSSVTPFRPRSRKVS